MKQSYLRSSNRRFTFIRPHGVIFQKIELFIFCYTELRMNYDFHMKGSASVTKYVFYQYNRSEMRRFHVVPDIPGNKV
jgi:hypothetical protein